MQRPGFSLLPLFALLLAASAHAQLYKWVGPDGKVTYSDTPPPSSAKRVETKSLSDNTANTSDFPFELAQATKGNPVTLYTTSNCAPCDEGRQLLTGRGIPFSEKTVTSKDDIAKFRQLDSEGRMPVLMIGRSKERGFEAGAWNTALTAAGYPQTSKLPPSYRQPAAQALVPNSPVATAQNGSTSADKPTSEARDNDLPPAVGNAPPGFRF
ncbi:glutaredoxin family protein [Noviherbaspirillum massiliense]|uniref:glutaredoxin family protein n=1 Tax=Noviherbaspirillum massiliense TaxID=1465823 RepID=UPI0002DD9622|nr:glutaredoxin family protein [Noviherbaspirillum massiliense]